MYVGEGAQRGRGARGERRKRAAIDSRCGRLTQSAGPRCQLPGMRECGPPLRAMTSWPFAMAGAVGQCRQ
jgi:hypothetical protein